MLTLMTYTFLKLELCEPISTSIDFSGNTDTCGADIFCQSLQCNECAELQVTVNDKK